MTKHRNRPGLTYVVLRHSYSSYTGSVRFVSSWSLRENRGNENLVFEACTKRVLHAFLALLKEHIALGPNRNMSEHMPKRCALLRFIASLTGDFLAVTEIPV